MIFLYPYLPLLMHGQWSPNLHRQEDISLCLLEYCTAKASQAETSCVSYRKKIILLIISVIIKEMGEGVTSCTCLWIEQCVFDPWPGTLCCVLGQDTTLTVPLDPPMQTLPLPYSIRYALHTIETDTCPPCTHWHDRPIASNAQSSFS